MEWYYILIICLVSLTLLILITCFICFKMALYSKNKGYDLTFPNNPIYTTFQSKILEDINDVNKLEHKEITITSFDGLKLFGKYYEYQKNATIEIMFHGYKGNSVRDISSGVKRAFCCKRNALIVDQRASGNSEGNIISFGINEVKDCLKWIDYVINEFGNDVKIILTGVSMGAATVMNASSMDLPKNVIGILADCGYDSAKNITKKYIEDMKLPSNVFYPFLKVGAKIFGKVNLEEISPIESVKHSKVPIIFIHGEKDSFVPCEMSKKCYEACTSTKKLVIIKDAEHGISYLQDPDTYVNELNSFFK